MRRLPSFLFHSILVRAGLVALCALPASAQLQVVIAGGTAGAITIVDGDKNDLDKTVNDAVDFEQQIVLTATKKFIASGHAVQKVTAGKEMNAGFDRLTLGNNGTEQLTATIEVDSAAFAAIGPAFAGRVHIDGKYTADKAALNEQVTNAQVTIVGSVTPANVIGTIAVPAAVAKQRPVPFNPPDVSKVLQVAVTQGKAVFEFTLFPSDRIVLPGSAVLAGYTYDRELTVNSTADLPDGLPGDGVCDTGNATIGFTGVCTLRAALTEADQQNVVTAIHFNIPGAGVPKIVMDSNTTFNFGSMGALQQVIVDGTTQPAGQVEVDGSQSTSPDIAGNPIVGLDFVGQKQTVLGMVIHSFPSHGIAIRQSGSPFGGSDVIEDSFIGTDPTGQIAMGNGGDGVHIFFMPDNLIQDSVIANNGGQGVTVDGSAATGNHIQAISIRANTGPGIILSNGGNASQPAPSITSATSNGPDLTVAGAFHGAANTAMTFDFYGNSVCVSGAGEGETFVGRASATTDSSGDATFSTTLPADVASGQFVTATATDAAGNTSEFSACANVQTGASQPPVANAGPNQTVTVGTLVTLNGTASFDPGGSPLTFLWTQTSGPTVTLTGATTATPTFTPVIVGTYVFSLVVNNGTTSSAPSSVTITVVARPPAQQIQSLIAQVESLGLPKGTENSLLAKLNAALASLNGGNTESAKGQLNAFIHEVSAQSGKKIPSQEADALIASAEQIIAAL